MCVFIATSVEYFFIFIQCCGEEKWGDWRPHLAMVLSNLTHTLDLDTRTITTMGDTLGRIASKNAVFHCTELIRFSFLTTNTLPHILSALILCCGSFQGAD